MGRALDVSNVKTLIRGFSLWVHFSLIKRNDLLRSSVIAWFATSKQNLTSSKNTLHTYWLTICWTTWDLRSREMRKYQKNLKIIWRHSQLVSLSSWREYFALEVKNYAVPIYAKLRKNMKIFWRYLILLNLF